MAYVTSGAILEELHRLPQTNTANGYTATVATIDAHIVKVEDRINGMLASRYSVPFSSVPPLVRTIEIDLVSYRTIRSLYTRDGRNRSDYLDDYNQANDLLNKLAEGEIALYDSTGSILSAASTSRITLINDYQPTFNVDDEINHEVDPDHVKAVQDARG